MAFNKITRYENTDILINQNDVEYYGFDKHLTFGEILNIAIIHGCKIIVKAGVNGKWYLKGRNKNIGILKNKLNKAKGKFRVGVDSYFIKF